MAIGVHSGLRRLTGQGLLGGTNMKILGTICAIIAFVLCLTAGLWILTRTGLHFSGTEHDDIVWEAMGLYFIGKAFFVGPLLLLQSRRTQ